MKLACGCEVMPLCCPRWGGYCDPKECWPYHYAQGLWRVYGGAWIDGRHPTCKNKCPRWFRRREQRHGRHGVAD